MEDVSRIIETVDEIKTVVVVGPGRCGKTHHSKRLAAAYGCNRIVDGWSNSDPLTVGALHLSNEYMDTVPEGITQVNFYEACRFAGITP